jgi:hypothetical protein
MKDEFTNRLDAFRTTINFLFHPDQNPKWNGQAPLRFAQRTAEAASAVNALALFCQQQGSVITGSAQDKAREEKELEDAAYLLGQAVGECCGALGSEADAAKCTFSLGQWQKMRDATLLANAREVIRIAQLVLGSHATEATDCGITAAAIAACTKEADDFQTIITAPQQAIAGRKALTALLRDRFNTVEAIFARMDALVDQFPDKVFVASYKAARIIRDLGHGPATQEPTPPPAPQP